jgi:hypothetical protein
VLANTFIATAALTQQDAIALLGICGSNPVIVFRMQSLATGEYARGSFKFRLLTLHDQLRDLIGKLYIDWGPGARARVQRADRQNKTVTELRTTFKEPPSPGFPNFLQPLSGVYKLPKDWITALRARSVHLLTCPTTKEQYVGSATGHDGFWQPWQDYVTNAHGGNIGLKSRTPSDYHVSILEVAGTSATADDVISMEERWKKKLQSKAMGLNQ